MSPQKQLGLKGGIGLVIANMIGAGVFLSTGFMAQNMGPAQIVLAWVVGGVLAMCGAVAYAEVARLVPRSGGEYRYLSTLLHPAFGFAAGWASLVVGFAAPVAIDALAAGAFARAVGLQFDPRVFGSVLIVGLTAFHSMTLSSSARMQNVLVAIKVALMVAFILVGLTQGAASWPTWTPPQPASAPVSAFAGSLFYIAFAYSGWNAATYAAEEFENPDRQVPLAMVAGAALVTVVYVLVNLIFVFNLTPSQSTVVFQYDAFATGAAANDSVTLGQALMSSLLGPTAGKVMSAMMVVLFTSAVSAMTLIGPRVTAAMANDGFMPRALAAVPGQVPVRALVVQACVALLLLWAQDLRSALSSVGALLTLMAALTMSGLVKKYFLDHSTARPRRLAVFCGMVYLFASAAMLFFGLHMNPHLLWWIVGLALLSAFGWWRSRRIR
jgi:basic amino acid/polyamine antiporter, APA family